MFVKNGHVFDKIWAGELNVFRKWWVLCVVLTELTFFDQIWA